MENLRDAIGPALRSRYALEREIGEGATAVVFLAHDAKHDRKVAIKVLKPEFATIIGADRFHREIEVVAGLVHPHIMPLHDSGDAEGLLYYVMPFVEGESLRDRLERQGRLPIGDAVRIVREVAGALGFAHRRGIIHRDVKPGNILLPEDHALLADFGIAHLAESGDRATLTGTGLALGTPAYISPEQATGERDVDGRSDVYSLGCVLFESLTGEPPFRGTNVQALITGHLVDLPPRVRASRPEVSDGLEAVVQTALRKKPEERFQTAEEMAGSLDLVRGGLEALAVGALRKLVRPREHWLRGWRLALLTAAAVVVVAAGIQALRSALRAPGLVGPPTYVVLPHESGAASERESLLAVAAARQLRIQLSDWRSIRVVPEPALEGPTLELQLAGIGRPTLSLDSGRELAARLHASHLVYVDVSALGDSVSVRANVWQLKPDESAEIPVRRDGRVSELARVTGGIALEILGLHGESVEMADLLSRSPFHRAHQQFEEGRAALWNWRLAEAEAHFRAALDEDSAFAPAHHYLATALYWRTARDPQRLLDLGPTIAYHARRADQYGDEGRLRPGERMHVDAFNAFWRGDYVGARQAYDSILSSHPTDLEALVLRGAVELEDRWLAAGSGGSLAPRQDLGLARAVYDSATALTPEWQLAWGRLIDLDYLVSGAAYRGLCRGFQPPGPELIPPFVMPDAAAQQFFCPIATEGTVRWVPHPMSEEERGQAREGAEAMHRKTVQRLELWARVEHDQPRHHEDLAEWMLWERSAAGCASDPIRSDSLAAGAEAHLRHALAQRADTTPEDRVRLAVTGLAAGQVEAARRATDVALAALGDWRSEDGPTPPPAAANPYLAVGAAHPAIDIIERVVGPSTSAIRDPERPDERIPTGPVFAAAGALSALGYMGYVGPEVEDRVAALLRTWADPVYTDRQRALLRRRLLGYVGPALVHVPDLWAAWLAGLEDQGLDIPPVWRGLLLAETAPEEARAQLERAVAELDEDREGFPLRAQDFYLPLILAERIEADSVAEALRRRAARCPLGVDNLDTGWGMKRYLAAETPG